MKLIILLYLEDDSDAVQALLETHGVMAYSELPLEGHGSGAPIGWYGEIPPYHSRMAFTLVPEDRANALLEAVTSSARGVDRRHPIHALQLGVERVVQSHGETS